MLDRAKDYLRRVLSSLQQEIRNGTPVVGLEPSCVSVLRDELHGLFPDDTDAKRLTAQTKTLGELLAEDLDTIPKGAELRLDALVHGHCHHKSVLDWRSTEKVLDKLHVDAKVLDSGCCGMAGAFGYETDKYELSMTIGERVLLPAVRDADPSTMIVSDGFSCRGQIEQGTDRRPLHLAQVLHLALFGDRLPAERIERTFPPEPASTVPWKIGLAVAAGVLLGVAFGARSVRTGMRYRRSM